MVIACRAVQPPPFSALVGLLLCNSLNTSRRKCVAILLINWPSMAHQFTLWPNYALNGNPNSFERALILLLHCKFYQAVTHDLSRMRVSLYVCSV